GIDLGGTDGGAVAIDLGGTDGGAQWIIIVDSTPAGLSAESISGLSLPFGYNAEGMMTMMGESGFGPGPKLLTKLDLSELGLPGQLGPGEEACILLQAQLIGGAGGTFPADSYFDVFAEIDGSFPRDESSDAYETYRFPAATPPYAFCTPTSLPASTPTSTTPPPTSTPTPRLVIQPSATTRTGLPTNTPVSPSRPTATPGRR
ncbi:MAG: hypothetical protein PVI04_04885, partial [Anaerolineales bacterium]